MRDYPHTTFATVRDSTSLPISTSNIHRLHRATTRSQNMSAFYRVNRFAPAVRGCFGDEDMSLNSTPPSISALGATRTFPLSITTPLKLSKGARIWLKSPSPVGVIVGDGCVAQLTCHDAMRFEATSETRMLPTQALDHTFATGWSWQYQTICRLDLN